MIVCYGWTNTQLINLVNVKVNSYEKEEADLIILKLERISERLVQSIKDSRIFNSVFYIDPPSPLECSLLGKIPLIKNFLFGKHLKEYYNKVLKASVGNTVYCKMLTAGYWADTIFLLRYFSSTNSNIMVSFVEEGINGYYADKEWLCKVIIGGRVKERIIRVLYFGWFSRRCNNMVDSIYLYKPHLRRDKKILKPYRILQINESNQVCYGILKEVYKEFDFSQYDKRTIYYIATPTLNRDGEIYDKYNEILPQVVETVGKDQIVIKVHPVTIENDPNFAIQYENAGVFVDRRNFLFEGIFNQVNMENKILVTKDSTVAMYPKFIFNKEPFIIFTYRIYNCIRKEDRQTEELYALDLMSCYSNKNKIKIVDSIFDLQNTLREICVTNSVSPEVEV